MNDRLFCQIPRPKIGIRVVVDGRCNGVREKLKHRLLLWRKKPKSFWRATFFTPMDNPWNA